MSKKKDLASKFRQPPDLASLRKRRGVTLERISEDTKISVGYLRAIEDGDYERLPGGIYNTSYIRQYARAIDYDEADLLACYYAETGVEPPTSPLCASEDENGKKTDSRFRFPALLRMF